MNPFNEKKIEINDSYNIKLWTEKRGRKTDTYLSGWLQEKNDLLVHHKQLKKNLGCNGTVKYKIKDENKVLLFHLQGDRVYDVTEYLKGIGIKDNEIEIIG
jgi:translation initiation factor 1 (eIF-1/SUI1)